MSNDRMNQWFKDTVMIVGGIGSIVRRMFISAAYIMSTSANEGSFMHDLVFHLRYACRALS